MALVTTTKILLPSKKSEVNNEWICQKLGVIGPPGIGKSEFFSHGENTLFLQTEAGLNHLSVFKVALRSWDDVREVYAQLLAQKQEAKLTYDTIIIDTIDRFIDLANQEAIARGRAKFKTIEINTVGDVPNGAGWMWAQELVESALTKLEELGVCVCYIGHLDIKEVKTPTSSYHKKTISIGGKMGGFLTSWPDHLLNIESTVQGNNSIKRVIRTLPSLTMDAKSRGGMIADCLEWTSNSKDNYNKLRSMFK